MSPELKLVLDNMHEDIREMRGDVAAIKIRLAGKDGAEKAWRHLGEVARWAVAVIVAFFAGHVGGTH